MTKYAYSPHTGEFINIDNPAEWMEFTTITPPVYDSETSGCFFRNGAWEIISSLPKILSDAQTARLVLIESSYATAMSANVAYLGTSFQADAASQQLIAAVLTASGGALPAGFGWYDINNTKVVMTFAQLQGLAGTILLRGQPLFEQKQARKSAIRSATTVAQVEAVTW